MLFAHRATPPEQAAAGFGVEFEWDRPLLDGYPHRFLTNVARRPDASRFLGLNTPSIGTIVATRRPHAVLINGWHHLSAWQTVLACRRLGVPALVRGDSHLYSPRSRAVSLAKEPVYRMFVPRLDACAAVGHWSRQYFLHYGANPHRVFLIPHSVDERFFEREHSRLVPQKTEVRLRWGLTPESTVFLFVGKLIAKKRPSDFIEALLRAHRGGARVAGALVGDGPLRPDLEARVKETGAPVRFAGFLNQSQMPTAYAASDALVLPSDGGETWGLVVNEAMTCGLPCIVSDAVGCGPDLVLPGHTGHTFPVGDASALAALMAAYADDPEAVSRMGASARSHIRAYSTEAATAGVLRALEILAPSSVAKSA